VSDLRSGAGQKDYAVEVDGDLSGGEGGCASGIAQLSINMSELTGISGKIWALRAAGDRPGLSSSASWLERMVLPSGSKTSRLGEAFRLFM
jgi:hypothetical protein